MKALKRIYIFMMLGMILGCSNQVKEQTSKEILANEQKQEEIMDMICNNHEMMSNFMEHMMKSEHAMQMTMGNQVMMQQLMDGEHMMDNVMQMMLTDGTMCKSIQQMMMDDEHMKDVIMEMWNRQGMAKGDKMKVHVHMNNHKTDN